ncbi:hypothetical protein OROGR_025295 [Orobanche gracilis]
MGGPKRRRLTKVDAGSILTTLFAVSCSASMEDAASLDYVKLLEAAIESKTAYVDIADHEGFARRAKSYKNKAIAAGVPAITNSGANPGVRVNTTFIHNAQRESKGQPERLRYHYFTAGNGGNGPGVLSTSFYFIADESKMMLKPYSDKLSIDFGEGIGNKNVFLIELLKDKNIVQLLSKVSYRFIRAVDKISGEKAAIKVDLQCTDGYNAAAIFSRERLAEAVGTATAAFVLAVLEGSTKPGVWYPEEGGPKRRRLTRVDAGSILTTLFAVSCSASMEDAASLDYGVLGVQVGDIIFYDGKVVHGSTFFRYLGSIIQKDGELDGDVAHRIKTGWLKWKSATGVLCDPDMPHRLKGKFYRTTIRPALLYGTECWAVKRCHVQKMNVAEMRMLRWMCGHTKKDRLRNEVIREK